MFDISVDFPAARGYHYHTIIFKIGRDTMSEQFKDKVALVTGGASGMGRATALRLASQGAKVAITANRNTSGAEECVRQITQFGGTAVAIACQVADAAQVEALVDAVCERWGRLDFAFNNAGIGVDGVNIKAAPITEFAEEDYDQILNTNLKGVFLCMKYELRKMQQQGSGCIVNNASLGALSPKPGDSAYAASKSGVVALTSVGALEAGPFGVRVNAICPGPITGTNLLSHSTGNDPEILEHIRSGVPLGRVGTTEDIADVVTWLCSDQASFLNGVVIPVDGGLVLR
jgi:NAD(P)-dependent dehydrogenase (short-subunit alcohol dehydrogenase family)